MYNSARFPAELIVSSQVERMMYCSLSVILLFVPVCMFVQNTCWSHRWESFRRALQLCIFQHNRLQMGGIAWLYGVLSLQSKKYVVI